MGPGQSGALFKASDMTLMCLQAKNKKQKTHQQTPPPHTHKTTGLVYFHPSFGKQIWKTQQCPQD